MAVIDETWELRREFGVLVELRSNTGRTVCDWPLDSDAESPSDEDGKLLASVPDLLRENARLQAELELAEDIIHGP